MTHTQATKFERTLSELINSQSLENDSNTPDFILANYLRRCLDVYNDISKMRDKCYGIEGLPVSPRIVKTP